MSKQTKLSRREFLKLGGGGLAAAALLSACGGQQATHRPQRPHGCARGDHRAGRSRPDCRTCGEGQRSPRSSSSPGATRPTVPAWEVLGPEYTKLTGNVVNITPVADPNANYYTKLQTMFAGGTPPNLASFQGWEWQAYADKGLLQPVDDWITRDKVTNVYPSGYTSVEQSTKRNGKTFLIPLQAATMIMFYAKKIFDDAGVAYPKTDWTFDEFVETAKKLTDAGKGLFGYQVNGNWYRDIGWIVGTGKREFDTIIDPKKAMFNQPEIVDRITTTSYDMPHTWKVAPSPADTSGANTINTGKCAMKYEGPWFLPQLNSPKLREQKKEVPFDVVLMPKTPNVSGRPHRGWGEGVAVTEDRPGRGRLGVRRVPGERSRQQAVLHHHRPHPVEPRPGAKLVGAAHQGAVPDRERPGVPRCVQGRPDRRGQRQRAALEDVVRGREADRMGQDQQRQRQAGRGLPAGRREAERRARRIVQ